MPEHGRIPAKRRPRWWIWALLAGLSLGLVAAGPAGARHLRATALLLSVLAQGRPPAPIRAVLHHVEVTDTAIPNRGRALRARSYTPAGGGSRHGVVFLHGIHPQGIDEARLVAFARALASTGFTVITPELPDLLAGRVTPAILDDLTVAVRHHATATGAPVGVWGISVAGGLALVAAARPGASSHFDHVVAVGAHADLERVVRFHRGEVVRGPNGETPGVTPHPYGSQVLLHADAPDLAAVSPQGHLDSLRVPVFLLHGLDDPVIPALETLTLAREVPRDTPARVLVTPVLRHAESTGTPSLLDAWTLVHFVAAILAEGDD